MRWKAGVRELKTDILQRGGQRKWVEGTQKPEPLDLKKRDP